METETIIEALVKLIEQEGYSCEIVPEMRDEGHVFYSARQVLIRASCATGSKGARVIAHELGHIVLHSGAIERPSKAERDVQAELFSCYLYYLLTHENTIEESVYYLRETYKQEDVDGLMRRNMREMMVVGQVYAKKVEELCTSLSTSEERRPANSSAVTCALS